jgi:hypothetical protein
MPSTIAAPSCCFNQARVSSSSYSSVPVRVSTPSAARIGASCSARWLADEIVEPVLAEVGGR